MIITADALTIIYKGTYRSVSITQISNSTLKYNDKEDVYLQTCFLTKPKS